MFSFRPRSFAYVAFSLYSLVILVDATSFTPVRRQLSRNGVLRNRDLATRTELLRPRHDVDLHYLPEDGSNSILITVTASHAREKYVALEDIDPLIYNVLCSDDTNTLSLDFRQDAGYQAAKQLWTRHEDLLFVTHHLSCNSDSERAVHRASKMTFDDDLLRMTASSQSVSLGDSAHASSKLTISGAEIGETDLKRLSRRDDGPEVTKSRTFDLNAAFTSGKDHLVTVDGLEVYCDDCSVTGQASPFFKYEINTDIMDCVDKIAALKRQKGDTFWSILKGIGQDIETSVDCIGDGVQALAKGLAHDVANLIDGKADGELPVVSWIVPEAVLGIEASENIAAKLNFEASSTEGVDIKCSFPGVVGPKCGVSAVSALLAPKSSKSPGDFSFSIGTWELSLGFTYGLTIEAKAIADIDIKVPISAEVAKGQAAQLSLISPAWHNTFDPKINVGEPAFTASNPEVCLSVALGPSIAASLSSSNLPRLSNLRASARLDLPRVQSCFKTAKNVGTDCKAGEIKDALELDLTADFGLDVELHSVFQSSENLTPFLYKSFGAYKQCFDFDLDHGQTIVNGTKSGPGLAKNPSQPLTPLSDHNGTWQGWNHTGSPGSNGTDLPTLTGSGYPSPTAGEYAIPTIGRYTYPTGNRYTYPTGIGSTNPIGSGYANPTGSGPPLPSNTGAVQGNYTSPYDCASVGPSPGGQLCAYMGGGPAICLSLYSWSCPNGDSGSVPADTICACGAFRHPGWQPPSVAKPVCTSGIHCYDEKTFGVCGPAGIEPPQPVAPGTLCIGGAITYPY